MGPFPAGWGWTLSVKDEYGPNKSFWLPDRTLDRKDEAAVNSYRLEKPPSLSHQWPSENDTRLGNLMGHVRVKAAGRREAPGGKERGPGWL